MDKLKLDIQRFAPTPPTSGNLIDEDCLYEYHQNIKNYYAPKTITGDLTNLTTTSKTNLVSAINEVNGRTLGSWTSLGTKTGSASISIPSGATELYILGKIDNNDNLAIPFYIPIIPTSQIRISGGYWQSASYGGRLAVDISSTSASIFYAYLNGSTVLNTSTITVYYR